ncbi:MULTISPECIES: HpcH/HpaI aldolase/citrate lyase family protein [unclassified Undibacterium]|uniref:HpcH/HpaI aldolase/citrate lyase family protein n=1 Tax=unclassified Undibacterium TaxID=2630295 RepID=UPI002AC8DE18|nr:MULTISPECIES: aldolase/citrate lyase family protein [unclassified Undibacterium]MEB0140315.1 aldolase/citrate lyase family protein [Undibacterium sp. CCC2.1]MEB0173562.1 aldolase/citrate lyase family protein [Undibacterium sp. CCC1.1]MEB0177223.1 aldolase/citrate lyase family protein [Undibacterium sp. CCC3.4]MEB0216488.1 aldolase/citrate lyase family protein [Undibacterium sp. 5I2]WPX43258.1 aldolase/citrate lyase family protein [Undibacterium sp. CCC3.4]
MHPSQALFQDQVLPRLLPVCDHYAGAEKLMRKALSLQQEFGPLFDITFDCEDGAATGNEATHAHMVATLINSADNRYQRVGVRVHDLAHPSFTQDLNIILAACATKLAYLVLPKVNSATQVSAAIAQINQHAQAAGRALLPIHVIIETHEALADVMAIAALPQIECLSFGIMDFVSAHYGAIGAAAMCSPGQFTHPLVLRAKLEIAAACHRYGKVASHNVTTEIRDLDVVAADAKHAGALLGYTRMWSIHPQQIPAILAALSPQHDEIRQASEILTAAQRAHWAPIQYDGKLHDRASYRYYWTLLQRAALSSNNLPDMAKDLLQGIHS